jgi:putative hydrolase of the HAD superfamily
VDAVIFDWGGTLTPWMDIDGRHWVRIGEGLVNAGRMDALRTADVVTALSEAEAESWRLARDEQRSARLEEMLAAVGLELDEALYALYLAEWEWATYLDPEVPALFEALRSRGIRVGVLSNTVWPRRMHEEIFARDGVLHLIDGAVYTSEIAWTKPHPEAFVAAMAAVGVVDAGRCVFVGDRPFDDIFGARRAGMRPVLLPHSRIPSVQRGHTDGEPDAVIQRLSEVVELVDGWRLSGTSGRPRS